MTLFWILKPREDLPMDKAHPWRHERETAHGFVIEAETEFQARQLASQHAGIETGEAWIDPAFSTCIPLEVTGTPSVVLIDYVPN